MWLSVNATLAMNSSPARDVSNYQDHSVNKIRKACREQNFILPNTATKTPQTEMIKLMAVLLGIPIIYASSSSSMKRTTGRNSSGLSLSWKIAMWQKIRANTTNGLQQLTLRCRGNQSNHPLNDPLLLYMSHLKGPCLRCGIAKYDPHLWTGVGPAFCLLSLSDLLSMTCSLLTTTTEISPACS
jgi:hypothetical protein